MTNDEINAVLKQLDLYVTRPTANVSYKASSVAANAKAASTALRQLQMRVIHLEGELNEAAVEVESVIGVRANFSGKPPYVGWKGLGLALTEKLDELEAANGGWDDALETAAKEFDGRVELDNRNIKMAKSLGNETSQFERMKEHHVRVATIIRKLKKPKSLQKS
jgi:hypothetical protein